jgi:excisionase family DNA binding protein
MTATTFTLDEAAAKLGCTRRWLADQIRARRFTARKIGKHWRMTQADIDEALEICKTPARRPTPRVAGADDGAVVRPLSFTATSRRRLRG